MSHISGFRIAVMAATVAIVISGIVAPVANAVVPGGPPNPLQALIAAASSGATIDVPPGTYTGGIDFGGKDVTLRSTGGPAVTTINGNGGVGVSIGPKGALDGFTITGSVASFGAGVVANGIGSLITHNIFDGNIQTAGGFGAAIGGNSASPTITANRFRHNTCDSQFLSGVVAFVNSSAPTISNNVFTDNPCRALNLTLPTDNAPVVTNNTFVNNSVGIRVDGQVPIATQIYRNNILVNNTVGLDVALGGLPTWDHNLVWHNGTDYQGTPSLTGSSGNLQADPMFRSVPNRDFDLSPGSAAIDAGISTDAPPDDHDGTLRPLDGNLDGTLAPDIGAYEARPDGRLHPIVPVRVLDTRVGQGGTRLGPGGSLTLTVPGATSGVPSIGAAAVSVNLTAVNPSSPTFLTAWPTGYPLPPTSSLNVPAGRTIANAVQVGLGTGGRITVFNRSGSVDVLVDIVGWFDVGGDDTGTRFQGIQPNRIVDTRIGQGGTTIGNGGTMSVHVAGTPGVPHTGISAVAINLTAVNQTASTYMTVWPDGPRPLSSNLNAPPGSAVPNLVVVGVSASGDIDVFNAFGTSDVLIDVVGWWSAEPGVSDGAFAPVVPNRVFDTRFGIGTSVHRIGPGESVDVVVAPTTGVSRVGVGAIAVNITAADPSSSSYVTAFPTGTIRPWTSNLNLDPHRDVAGFAIVKVGDNGKITLFNASGTVDLIVDVVGWYTGPLPRSA